MKEWELLQRKLDREKRARKQAEQLIEQKSREASSTSYSLSYYDEQTGQALEQVAVFPYGNVLAPWGGCSSSRFEALCRISKGSPVRVMVLPGITALRLTAPGYSARDLELVPEGVGRHYALNVPMRPLREPRDR
jgi:hypothetical protein